MFQVLEYEIAPNERIVIDDKLKTQFRQIALYDEDSEVRKLVLARITDQSVCKQIALNDKDPEVRKLALARITDQ